LKFARLAPVLFALLAASAVYLPRLSAPLMWDDRPFLLDNTAIERPISLKSYVSPDYFNWSGELTWRPLATWSYSALSRLFLKRPFPMRAGMLVLHLLNCALLAWLIAGAGLGAEVALIAAAFFLIHPAHVETLMCVTFNKEILCALGILGMLVAHQRGRAAWAAGFLIFALLPKEAGLAGPLLALLYDAVVRREVRWKDHALYAAIAAVYLAVRFGPLRGPGGEQNLSALLPFSERFYYAARGFASSYRVLLFPRRLRIDYFALPASSALDALLWVYAALAILAAVYVLARMHRKRAPGASFFLLWPLPFLFLTSNLLPTAVLSLRLMAERWLYLPALGFSAAAAYAVRERPRARWLLLCLWGVLGLSRAVDWQSESRLWKSLVDIYPWSAKANEGLADAYFREDDNGRALAYYERALALRRDKEDLVLRHYAAIAPPGTIGWDSPFLYRGLGLTRLRLGEKAAAEDMFAKAVALQPSDGFSYRVLSYLAAEGGDFPRSRGWLDKGLAQNPQDDFLRRLEGDVARRRLSFRARFD
jgi:tetratricopeptide (TPR) repeat protein